MTIKIPERVSLSVLYDAKGSIVHIRASAVDVRLSKGVDEILELSMISHYETSSLDSYLCDSKESTTRAFLYRNMCAFALGVNEVVVLLPPFSKPHRYGKIHDCAWGVDYNKPSFNEVAGRSLEYVLLGRE